jgi:hypothetical protein
MFVGIHRDRSTHTAPPPEISSYVDTSHNARCRSAEVHCARIGVECRSNGRSRPFITASTDPMSFTQ